MMNENNNFREQQISQETKFVISKFWNHLHKVVDVNKNLSQEIDSFKNKIKELQSLYSELQNNHDKLSTQFNTLQNQLSDSKIELENKIHRVTQLEQLVADLQGYNEKYHQLLIDYQRIKSENYALKQQNSDFIELQNSLNQITDEKQKLAYENEYLRKTIENYQRENIEIAPLQRDIAQKNKLLYEKDEEIERLKNQLIDYENKILQLENYASENLELKSQVSNLNTTVFELNEKNLSLANQIDSLNQKIEELENIRTNLIEELTKKEQEAEKSKFELEKVILENDRLKNEYVEYIEKFKFITEENDKLKKELELINLNSKQKEENIADLNKEIAKLRSKLFDSDAITKALQSQLQEALMENKVHEENIAQFHERIKFFEKELSNKDAIITELEKDNSKIMAEIEALNFEKRKLMQEHNEFHTKYLELIKQNEMLKIDLENLSSLKELIKYKEIKIQNLDADCNQLREELSNKSIELSKHKEQLNFLSATIAKKDNAIKDLEEKLSQFDEMQKELAALKFKIEVIEADLLEKSKNLVDYQLTKDDNQKLKYKVSQLIDELDEKEKIFIENAKQINILTSKIKELEEIIEKIQLELSTALFENQKLNQVKALIKDELIKQNEIIDEILRNIKN